MIINFSKYIFFLWFFFRRNVEVLSHKNDTIKIKTKLKELKLVSNKKIRINFFIIKYFPSILLLSLIISIKEILNLEVIILLSPLYILIFYIFNNYKIIVPITILSSILIFFFYNILLFPLFIKYCLISFFVIELIMDLFFRKQFEVYEDNKLVAYAITKTKEEK